MIAAAITALLPPRSTAILRLLSSPLAFAEAPLFSVVRTAEELAEPEPDDPDLVNRAALMQADMEWLERQVGHLDLKLREQSQQIEALSGLREELGSTSKIVIGRVLGPSPNPRESVLRVSLVGLEGVKVGHWVASGGPLDPNGPPIGQVLAGESLIGRVSAIDGWVATVQLATDGQFRSQVQLATPLDTARWEIVPGAGFALKGTGAGQMQIEGAEVDFYAAGAVIALVPASRLLPAPMTLGRISESQRRDDSQLHFDLTLDPWVRAADSRYVYIIAP